MFTSAQRDAVDDLVGVKYAKGGRSRIEGFDCLTLAEAVYSIAGRVFPLPDDYGEDHIPAEAFLVWSQFFVQVDTPELLAVCSIDDQRRKGWAGAMRSKHLGVVVSPTMVIHARKSTGVVKSRIDTLRPFIGGYARLRGDDV